MTVCVPIRDLKDTSGFAALVEGSPEPITVTRNGYDAFVAMSMDTYDSLKEEAAKAQLLRRIYAAEQEIEKEDWGDFSEFSNLVRKSYGL